MIIKEKLHPCNISDSEYFVLNECEFHSLNKILILVYSGILILLIIILRLIEP